MAWSKRSNSCSSFLQTWLLNQRAFIVSQILSIGFKSGEYGGKYFGCHPCHLVDTFRWHSCADGRHFSSHGFFFPSCPSVFWGGGRPQNQTRQQTRCLHPVDSICGWSIRSASSKTWWSLMIVILPGRFLTIRPSTPEWLKQLIHFLNMRLVTKWHIVP